MKKLFEEILHEAQKPKSVQIGDKVIDEKTIEKNVGVILSLMSTSGESLGLPHVDMREALGAADASILFPRAIDLQLIKPIEPAPLASTQLAKVITIDSGARSVVFPTLGAVRGAEIGDTQNYPEVHPGFAENTTEVKTKKHGLMIPVSEYVISESMWDVLALFLECGRNAMVRLKEEKCFKELTLNSHVVFDNDISDTDAQTTGTDITGGLNYTITWLDLVDMVSVLLANEFNPTDVCIHPLLWSAFAKDPILSYQVVQSGNVGQFFQAAGAQGLSTSMPVPYNLNVSPYIDYTASDTVQSLTGPSTSIHILDRSSSLVLLVKEALSTDEFTDPYRDIRNIKIKEYYGVGTLNAGKASVVAKKVRVAVNAAPLYTIRTI